MQGPERTPLQEGGATTSRSFGTFKGTTTSTNSGQITSEGGRFQSPNNSPGKTLVSVVDVGEGSHSELRKRSIKGLKEEEEDFLKDLSDLDKTDTNLQRQDENEGYSDDDEGNMAPPADDALLEPLISLTPDGFQPQEEEEEDYFFRSPKRRSFYSFFPRSQHFQKRHSPSPPLYQKYSYCYRPHRGYPPRRKFISSLLSRLTLITFLIFFLVYWAFPTILLHLVPYGLRSFWAPMPVWHLGRAKEAVLPKDKKELTTHLRWVKERVKGWQRGSRIGLILPPNSQSTSSRPETLNAIWHRGPGRDWYEGGLPIGNGYLGEMVSGGTDEDTHWINIASLWTGGPFHNSTYYGGNPPPSAKEENERKLQKIRDRIFAHGSSHMNELLDQSDNPDFGDYMTAGALTISSPSDPRSILSYTRSLDMDRGVVEVDWTERHVRYKRTSFCSYPSNLCLTHTTTRFPGLLSGPSTSPGTWAGGDPSGQTLTLTYTFSTPNPHVAPPTCEVVDPINGRPSNSEIAAIARGKVGTITQRGRIEESVDEGTQGMLYQVTGDIYAPGGKMFCSDQAAATISGAAESWIVWSGETDFKLSNCAREKGFTCRTRVDPSTPVRRRLDAAADKSVRELLSEHVEDYSKLNKAFELDIGQSSRSLDIATPTDLLVEKYDYEVGSPLLEWLVYSYGRHLLISSSREHYGWLPPNLQGIWQHRLQARWHSDFHSDVNIQMMQWPAETTGLAASVKNFGHWMLHAMADRGNDAARNYYGADGFVIHTQSNVHGFSGLRGEHYGAYHPEWADYTSTAAWNLQHFHDHLSFSPGEDLDFFREVSWPLMKRHALFQLDFLVPDRHFNDGTLVINPCNSAEHKRVTFGCTVNQQQIFELFHQILNDYPHSGDHDPEFIQRVNNALATMDKGIHIGSWGQFQEWKKDYDDPTDEHRHTSGLLGTYPGWQIGGLETFSLPLSQSLHSHREEILSAVSKSLSARGTGFKDDNAGWEKVMRSLVASSIGNGTWAGWQYRYMIWSNLNGNLMSMYEGHAPNFQMDANGGAAAVLVNMLWRSIDSTKEFRQKATTVTLLPALPPTFYPSGSFTNGRLRDGLRLDLTWKDSTVNKATITGDKSVEDRLVQVVWPRTIVTSRDASSSDAFVSLSRSRQNQARVKVKQGDGIEWWWDVPSGIERGQDEDVVETDEQLQARTLDVMVKKGESVVLESV